MSTPTTTVPAAPSYPPPMVPRTNTLAILSLVFAFVFWPAGIVLGHLARRQIAETGESGHGLATAGLIISYIGLACAVLLVFGMVAAVGHAAAITGIHGVGVIR